MVELESEEVCKANIDSPAHSGPVELEFENNSVTTSVVQTETAAARDLVLGAGMAQETGEPLVEPPGGAGDFLLVKSESEEVYKADIDSPTHSVLVKLRSEKK